MEPSYPNLLLVTDSTEALWSYIVLGFGLLIVIPLTCLCIMKKKAQIELFHPGQEKLQKIVCIEFLIFSVCLGVFIYSQTTEFESYTSQMMSFYIFFAGEHLILLML